jgi:hypothetical protein
MSKIISDSDFWWISPEEMEHYKFIKLYYQDPYSDEIGSSLSPLSVPLIESDISYSLDNIDKWRDQFGNVNVFRNLDLYSLDNGGDRISGPIVLDIDRCKDGDSYIPDINTSYDDVKKLIDTYCSKLNNKLYRVIFSGHKGFHVEIYPPAININPKDSLEIQFKVKRKEINKILGDGFIDKFHEHLRLHNSINRWIDYNGQRRDCMIFELTEDEIFNMKAEDIIAKSESLAKLNK